jgi:hypothetical protein
VLFWYRYFTAIWAVVKPWIDPVTRDKMELIGTDFLPTLREHIDDSQIPADLGGSYQNFVWSWPYPEESLCTPEHIAQYNAARGRSKVNVASGEAHVNVQQEQGEAEEEIAS